MTSQPNEQPLKVRQEGPGKKPSRRATGGKVLTQKVRQNRGRNPTLKTKFGEDIAVPRPPFGSTPEQIAAFQAMLGVSSEVAIDMPVEVVSKLDRRKQRQKAKRLSARTFGVGLGTTKPPEHKPNTVAEIRKLMKTGANLTQRQRAVLKRSQGATSSNVVANPLRQVPTFGQPGYTPPGPWEEGYTTPMVSSPEQVASFRAMLAQHVPTEDVEVRDEQEGAVLGHFGPALAVVLPMVAPQAEPAQPLPVVERLVEPETGVGDPPAGGPEPPPMGSPTPPPSEEGYDSEDSDPGNLEYIDPFTPEERFTPQTLWRRIAMTNMREDERHLQTILMTAAQWDVPISCFEALLILYYGGRHVHQKYRLNLGRALICLILAFGCALFIGLEPFGLHMDHRYILIPVCMYIVTARAWFDAVYRYRDVARESKVICDHFGLDFDMFLHVQVETSFCSKSIRDIDSIKYAIKEWIKANRSQSWSAEMKLDQGYKCLTRCMAMTPYEDAALESMKQSTSNRGSWLINGFMKSGRLPGGGSMPTL